MTPLRVVLVDGRPLRRMRLETTLGKNVRIAVLGAFDAMASSYGAIDAEMPDAVVLGGELSLQRGFDRFRTFVQERGIPIVPVWAFPFSQTELQHAELTAAERAGLARVPDGDTSFLIETIDAATRRPRPNDTVRAQPPPRAPATPALRQKVPDSATHAPAVHGAATPGLALSGAGGPDPADAAADPAPVRAGRRGSSLIVIGSSTGGIEALHTVLADFAEDCPPTLVVQHIRENFTTAFVQRADKLLRPRVIEARDHLSLESGTVYVAPGASRHLEIDRTPQLVCRLRDGPPVSGHRPSVDALFASAARQIGKRTRVIGVLLTGMGADGARGLLSIRESGGHTLAQDEETSVVYGMPRAAAELGAAAQVLPITRIARAIARDLASP